ncbi:trans-aconitate 2-methyltransferase [Roseovarius albus]|uniref:Trans-aconitate 2-methyltransferase n=1 Tax=Roseovarius albus TaxID=1247867 RepID=A0A1X6YZS1_9RHOB|nr:class I SAM-dependent methyltransferase [Roseovarius albus]SLN35726.1 trans-aconitate 2-methyltransferase [Roseovarius albus]
MTEKFFDKVYDVSSPDERQEMYGKWAATYDAEVADNGYATPPRVAKALAKFIADCRAPVLDFGCGTGLSGLALRQAGFTQIDGMDPNAEMLSQATEKDAYRNLIQIDIADETPIPQGTYAAITAIGVIGTGAAPADTLHTVMKALPKGGLLGLSLNDHALADPSYERALCDWLDCGAALLLFKKYGPHLPGQDIKSNVYIVEKK